MRPSYSDTFIRQVLQSAKTIALVGASAKPERDSFQVMKFLLNKGHRVIPVNPGLAGGHIHGQKVYGSLGDIEGPFDMVDVFRNSEALPGLFDEVKPLIQSKAIKSFWTQLNVYDQEVEEQANASGLNVIMDRCPVIEYGRLF